MKMKAFDNGKYYPMDNESSRISRDMVVVLIVCLIYAISMYFIIINI
jgi:hypothetical protein